MAALVLNSVTPPAQRNGEFLLLNGSGFRDVGRRYEGFVIVESLGLRPYTMYIPLDRGEGEKGWQAYTEFNSDTQIIVKIGDDIEPGQYSFRVYHKVGGEHASDRVDYEFTPWSYVFNFMELKSIDESNEASDSDELKFAWALANDAYFRFDSSGEFSVDAGKSYTLPPYLRELLGAGVPVSRQLSVVVHLFEFDEDGPLSLEAENASTPARVLIDTRLEDLKVIPELTDLLASNLADAVENAWSDMSKNDLGVQSLAWNVEDLRRLTSNDTRSFGGMISFENADSEGSHIITYEVVRVYQ